MSGGRPDVPVDRGLILAAEAIVVNSTAPGAARIADHLTLREGEHPIVYSFGPTTPCRLLTHPSAPQSRTAGRFTSPPKGS